MNIASLAEELGAKTYGDNSREIERLSPPESADPKSICLIWDKKALDVLPPEIPIIAPEDFFTPGRNGIISTNPRALLPKLTALFIHTQPKLSGIHPQAAISPTAKISPTAYVGACAYIGDGCVVGDGTVIEPNSTLVCNVKVGSNCLIHSGAVIGADGFGFERTPEGLVKIPQTGGVSIGDDVEIGACTTIDRGTMSDTVISSGTKLDNHVQIGHNVHIGRNCIICSMTGIAGSSVIEDNVTISVQAGITDHVRVGEGSVIAGRSGITKDVPPKSVMSGFPARPHNEAKRALVLSANLPSLYKRVRNLEKWCKNHEA